MSAKGKVLITEDAHPALAEGLQNMGFTADYRPLVSPDEVLNIIHEYEGLIINSKVPANRQMFDAGVNLKFICRLGSGLEVIDLVHAKQKGIAAINSPEGNCNAVAEHTLGMLLALLNNITIANSEVKQGMWNREPNRGVELGGKTVGLIAYGHTAQAFATLLSGFDMKILAYDKYKTGFSGGKVKEASLDEIFEQADILSLHLPLTEETRYMVNEEFLNSFKKPIYLINTSRGKVLKTNALLNALENKKILGAALDVLENEKPDTYNIEEKAWFDALKSSLKVILTPHIAGWTIESKKKIAEILLAKIAALYA
jgi:D-3-phosphoglycerate dehydrogenase